MLIFLNLSLYTEVASPGDVLPVGRCPQPWVAAGAWPGRVRTAPGDDVRLGSAPREDLTLPAGPHSTFNKEAKKEPLNNVVFQ